MSTTQIQIKGTLKYCTTISIVVTYLDENKTKASVVATEFMFSDQQLNDIHIVA